MKNKFLKNRIDEYIRLTTAVKQVKKSINDDVVNTIRVLIVYLFKDYEYIVNKWDVYWCNKSNEYRVFVELIDLNGENKHFSFSKRAIYDEEFLQQTIEKINSKKDKEN